MERLKTKEHRRLMDLLTGWTIKEYIIRNIFTAGSKPWV